MQPLQHALKNSGRVKISSSRRLSTTYVTSGVVADVGGVLPYVSSRGPQICAPCMGAQPDRHFRGQVSVAINLVCVKICRSETKQTSEVKA